MTTRGRAITAALSATGCVFLLTGCLVPDVGPPVLRVYNYSSQALEVSPKVADRLRPPQRVASGESMVFDPVADGCESRAWVARSESGSVVAEVAGACSGHTWTISGPGESSYK